MSHVISITLNEMYLDQEYLEEELNITFTPDFITLGAFVMSWKQPYDLRFENTKYQSDRKTFT